MTEYGAFLEDFLDESDMSLIVLEMSNAQHLVHASFACQLCMPALQIHSDITDWHCSAYNILAIMNMIIRPLFNISWEDLSIKFITGFRDYLSFVGCQRSSNEQQMATNIHHASK
ncbi:predicted protein [Sclerotinia sclerotiorum 1980 UF-70]|uniref:Uncharacterized protein n=2 Tax=Sclerotinia sclerotiorum (strain ATCC 18683 / 1980 / Ss-1) TaxID=665079 RepID=A7F9W4_SCLS1|nr:predicted protein [Sclerotinia sclerotiorum 1980 UF-70]APA14918.1 hypothetical protein sscle_13g096880 [Sclerotinia sclerotiorum 1980 UF-70]EDO00525.1 predicted protein [Sclerotinia sclerotiorum 1980 UF-70]